MLRSSTEAKSPTAPPRWLEQRPVSPGVRNPETPGTELGATSEMLGLSMVVGRGRDFFTEGAAAGEVFRLVSGSARLVKFMNDGRRQICEFIMPGDFLGLAYQDEHQFSAEALEKCVALRFPRAAIEARIAADPEFAGEIRRRAAKGLNNAYERMVFLCHRSATARVAWFLQTARLQPVAGRSDTFHLPMTRSDIGDYLGMALETASRAFTQIKRAGAILEPDLHLITFADRARLKDIVDNG